MSPVVLNWYDCITQTVSRPSRYSLMLRQAGGSLWANRKVVKRSEWADDISNFTSRCSRILRGNLYKDEQHLIYNFIFQYYFSLNPKCLTHFSPGLNVELEDVDSDTATRCLAGVPSAYLPDRSAYLIDRDALPFPSSKVKTMSSVMQLLKAVDSRRPSLRCYGLHEWAMLYRSHITEANNESTVTKLSKFQSLPLRVTAADIQRVLIPDPAVGPILRCTHYDAIRFFTEDAKGLNRITDPVPSR